MNWIEKIILTGYQIFLLQNKLMQIELSNRKWSFLRLLSPPRIVTIIVIVPHPIFEIFDARCIDLELWPRLYSYMHHNYPINLYLHKFAAKFKKAQPKWYTKGHVQIMRFKARLLCTAKKHYTPNHVRHKTQHGNVIHLISYNNKHFHPALVA